MTGPHQGQPVSTAGSELSGARCAIVLVHGRGGDALDMLGLATELDREDFAYLAPQAAGRTWYPHRFLAPLEDNEPHLSSALALVDEVVGRAGDAGIPPERLVLLGFSQGACLALEFAARNARRYGGVVGLSGGLIGPPGRRFEFPGSFDGTPVFLGCSDRDPHVPLERVEETAAMFEGMDADVDLRIYPGMGHLVSADEIAAVRELMSTVGD